MGLNAILAFSCGRMMYDDNANLTFLIVVEEVRKSPKFVVCQDLEFLSPKYLMTILESACSPLSEPLNLPSGHSCYSTLNWNPRKSVVSCAAESFEDVRSTDDFS